MFMFIYVLYMVNTHAKSYIHGDVKYKKGFSREYIWHYFRPYIHFSINVSECL